jgi:TPR repeat protein
MEGTFLKFFLRPYRCRDCNARFVGLRKGVKSLLKGLALSGIIILILYFVISVLIMTAKKSGIAASGSSDFLRNMRLAEQGETDAQFNVGLMYLNGTGTNKDSLKAIQWLERAAKKGNTDAMYHLGRYYADPERLKTHRDRQRGITLIRRAAEQGHVEAQYLLGMLYYKGTGVIQDFEEGVRWIRKAADRGMTDAMYQMGLLCLTGRGVDKDYVQSYVWFNVSAAQGRDEAATQRKLVAETLSIDELIEAQRRSRNFKPVSAEDRIDTSDEHIPESGVSH